MSLSVSTQKEIQTNTSNILYNSYAVGVNVFFGDTQKVIASESLESLEGLCEFQTDVARKTANTSSYLYVQSENCLIIFIKRVD